MENPVTLTVVIATYNRAAQLAKTLNCLREQQPNAEWEVLVVNNGSTDHTPEVIRQMSSRLPLRGLHYEIAGKAHALNLALDNAHGRFIAFTDDDVQPSNAWLSEIMRAFRSEDCGAVCGPIIAALPDATPSWLRLHPYSAFSFGNFWPNIPEGPLPPVVFPYGANFAVRVDRISGIRFREDLGRTGKYPWRMNADTDFQRHVRERCGAIFFMPEAIITHYVDPARVRLSWIFDNAFNLGRSYILMEPRAVCLAVPNQDSRSEVLEFEVGVQLNFYCGQLQQLQLDGREEVIPKVADMIAKLSLPPSPALLGKIAKQWLAGIAESKSTGNAQAFPAVTG